MTCSPFDPESIPECKNPKNMQKIKSFFDELTPRLETARVLDKELDRNLAHRFNVLDYLKTDELGLSRIIADLFDPKASHGQGVLFLRNCTRKARTTGTTAGKSRATL